LARQANAAGTDGADSPPAAVGGDQTPKARGICGPAPVAEAVVANSALQSKAAAASSRPRAFQPRPLVERLGTERWEEIARFLPERSARQCRYRYRNCLAEALMTNPWTTEEDAVVIQKFHQIGQMWVEIG
jgi:hypothetical protein